MGIPAGRQAPILRGFLAASDVPDTNARLRDPSSTATRPVTRALAPWQRLICWHGCAMIGLCPVLHHGGAGIMGVCLFLPRGFLWVSFDQYQPVINVAFSKGWGGGLWRGLGVCGPLPHAPPPSAYMQESLMDWIGALVSFEILRCVA